MSLESLDNNSALDKLSQIIDALKEFRGHYTKKLNFSGLMEILKISSVHADEFISIIMRFQDLFNLIFKDYNIEKRIIDRQIYLKVCKKNAIQMESKDELRDQQVIQKEIIIPQKFVKLLSDLIYIFKFIERGNGFDLNNRDSKFLEDVGKLKDMYPLLFIENGNKLSYPSELALKLGELILSHDISNKKLSHVEIIYKFNLD